jgi:3',5'-nucleoside bisphosphate phosphatase
VARETLRAIARNLDLVVTGSSDYHGTGKVDHELGCNTTDPDDYARLLERAASAAAASGRTTPEVVVA